jgi:hypothetical protein
VSYPFRKYPSFVLALLIACMGLLSGCFASNSYQDGDIDPDIKAKIDNLNKEVVKAFENNNPKQLTALCSKPMIEKGIGALDTIMENAKGLLHQEQYKIRNQFYQRGQKNANVVLSTGKDHDHDYSIHYVSVNRKSFVTVGYFEDTAQTVALTTIYGNYDGEWKLNLMRVGVIKVLNMDAVDWYYKAKQLYEKGDYVDAYNKMNVCNAILQPAEDLWTYALGNEMTSLYNDLQSIVKNHYPLPMVADDLQSKPDIIAVSGKIFTDGFYPVVSYTSKLGFRDSASMARECDSLNAHIGELFQGLDHNNKMLVYRVYQQGPAENNIDAPHYEFIRKSVANWY